jgi:hypothetical protein
MSKSHTSHQGRIPFQPQSGTNQTVEAARQDGTADHKKAKNEAMIPTSPEVPVGVGAHDPKIPSEPDATGDETAPRTSTTSRKDK